MECIEKLVNKQVLSYFVSLLREELPQQKKTRSIIRSLDLNFSAYELTEAYVDIDAD